MQAEIIAIGDELTSGQRLDTNTQWLSRELGELGLATGRHTTVGDDLTSNIDALRSSSNRADIVICTGGLGPTQDDLTRQAMAEAFDCPLRLDEESLQRIEKMFASRNRPMPERNRIQAMFPLGSQVIPNPHGSAPGVDLSLAIGDHKSRIFALPGVPAEMKQMWHETVVPRIEQMQAGSLGQMRHHSIKLFGIGESDVEVRLPTLTDRQRTPTVGITVSRATITLRITGRAASDEQFAELIRPTVDEIQTALSDLIFGEGDDELEHAILRQLGQQQLTLASLEVGAASWVSDWMLRADGAEQGKYAGGLTFPGIQPALRWLDAFRLQSKELSRMQAEPIDLEPIWNNLARHTRERFQADIGLAIGTYPTPAQMQTTASPFDCFFAIALPERVIFDHRQMGGHPDVLGPRIAKTGLDLLRKHLQPTEHKELFR